MNRGAFDFLTKPIDLADLEVTIRKTIDEIAKLREIERQRAAAERARNNLSRYFSPNLVEMLAERTSRSGPVRRQDGGGAVRRHRRLHGHVGNDAAGSSWWACARVPRAHDGQIFACGGAVEKYIGDAMLATFGVTQADARDPARRAGLRRFDAGRGRDLERRTGGGRRTLAIGHRPQLRTGGAGRCRQRSTACRSPSSAIRSTPRAGCRR